MGAARRAWNAAAHPRGPNGRFIKGGGSNSASAPTRSAAAALSGTRPGSAAALFTAGAGKGKIHAATSRPSRPATPRPEATRSKAAASPKQLKTDIRAAVAGLQSEEGGWVGLADLRDQLGAGRSREDVDAALLELLDEPGVRIIPVANTKALKPRDRAAAVRIGGEDNHAIAIDARDAPKAKAAAAAPEAPTVSKSGVDLSKVRGMGVFSLDPEVRAAAMAYGDKFDADRADAEAKLLAAGKIGPKATDAEIAERRQQIAKSTISASDLYRDKGQSGLAEIAAAHQAKPARKRSARPAKKTTGEADARFQAAHDAILRQAAIRPVQSDETPPASHLDRLSEGTLRSMVASAPGSPLAQAAQAALDRRPAPASTGRHPGYDGLDPQHLDILLGDNNINATGMSLEQKRSALAANDARLGVSRWGAPSRTPDVQSTGSTERTEISGWKGGKSPRGAAKPGPRQASTSEISASLSAATTRDQGRAALSGLTVSQLHKVAAANGVTVGSSYPKAKLADTILQQLVGRRLDSAAIHQMTSPKKPKSARQIMQAGG